MVGQEDGSSLAGWFWLMMSHNVSDKMLSGATSSESLTGIGGTTSNVAH